ncbi:MFS transporter [Paenibacillus sp. S150]|uniref:MFS transporter n=1 Tax=Paenibacillus sp. S150 TaxID=2749826 RepID=UPI001C59ADC6|nr:MFS transporter [Paenibacillus sp. S150]MBW4080537.1 MFS transporter [Paenibacillus sp. S150]
MDKTQTTRTTLIKKRISSKRVWLTAWMITAVFILSNSATPLYVYWQQEINFSNSTLTLIFASYIAGLLLTLLFAGQLSDRYGRKPVLFPGITAAIMACVLFANAHSVLALLAARFLSGIAVGVIVSAGMASVADVGGTKLKQTASLAASVSMVLGAGLGPLLSGILTSVLLRPVVPLFLIQAVFLISACFVVWTLPQRNTDLHDQNKWNLHWPGVPSANRLHLALGIAAFAPGITATSFVLSLGPSLLSKLLHVTSPLVAGTTACVMFLTATGIQFVLNKLPVRTIFIVSMTATILSMAGLVAAVALSSAMCFFMAAIFAGMGQGLGQLGGLTLIGVHVPEHRRAEANAVLNLGGYIPAALLPVCTGFLIDSKGLVSGTTGFAFILTVLVISAFFFVLRQAV